MINNVSDLAMEHLIVDGIMAKERETCKKLGWRSRWVLGNLDGGWYPVPRIPDWYGEVGFASAVGGGSVELARLVSFYLRGSF